MVMVGNNTSATLILNTGTPQGCVLSPLLYSLFTHDCTAMHDSTTIIQFANDTSVVGLITENNVIKTPPFSSTEMQWSRLRASSSLVSTSPTH